MAQALTAPIAIAALVLCVAGVAKLRRPVTAARALREAGLPGDARLVRAFGTGELSLGVFSLVGPSRLTALALSIVYLGFAALAVRLTRRAASCGCFGTGDAPASVWQATVSGAFGVLAACAVAWPAHSAESLLARPPLVAASLVLGLLGGAYAAVLAYTELPAAWSAWSRT